MGGLAWLMAISAVLATTEGTVLLLAPSVILALHGMPDPSVDALALARMLGTMLIGFGVMNWIARRSRPSLALWGMVFADALADTLSFGVALREQWLGAAVDVSGWLTVGLYLFFALGFWYFFLTLPLRGPQTQGA